MHYMEDGSLQNDEYSDRRDEEYGECPTCYRYNTDYSWCQSCNPKLLTEGWTSGNETLEELIKSTQLKAKYYNNHHYLQWIPYNDLTNIEKIGEGGFATISKATWLNGCKDADYKNERTSEDRTVALKKLHNSQNISDEFLNEVNYFIFLLISDFLNIILKFNIFFHIV
jgi:hypothetical protein